MNYPAASSGVSSKALNAPRGGEYNPCPPLADLNASPDTGLLKPLPLPAAGAFPLMQNRAYSLLYVLTGAEQNFTIFGPYMG